MTQLAPITPSPTHPLNRAAAILREALRCDREGRTAEAIEGYGATIATAEAAGDNPTLAEALRRLGVLQHRSNQPETARELCRRSYETATRAGDHQLAAEAVNALAGFELESGALDAARETYERALALAGMNGAIRGRIEQNLGVLANIRGDHEAALAHYERSLVASLTAGDDRGCAMAYHNLGMIHADQQRWDEADRFFRHSYRLAEQINDTHLRGLCLLNHAEVHLALRRDDEALRCTEGALAIFDMLDAHLDKPDAYKMLGIIYRESGRAALAESRLRTAIELAVNTGAVLSEAETNRELALLYRSLGRNQEALRLLNSAYRLFGTLDARADLVDVASRVDDLESTYRAVVLEWGQSIESADGYTYGHCERVADYGVAVAEALGLDENMRTTIRLGAYLHDLGKVRVPPEVLNKPGRLTAEEFEIIKKHPEWGVEMVADIEFPWDIKPIIRWHHEKYDGTGYPDGLKGDEIPITAQIICAVDVYDALTTTRSYRGAMTRDEALAKMDECRQWWRADVYQAFRTAIEAATLSPSTPTDTVVVP